MDRVDGGDGTDTCLGGENDTNCESGVVVPTRAGEHRFLPKGSVYSGDDHVKVYPAPSPSPSG